MKRKFFATSALAAVFLASSSPAWSAVVHPYTPDLNALGITLAGNNSSAPDVTIDHPIYSGSPSYVVSDLYKCDSASTFAVGANPILEQSIGNGNLDWPLTGSQAGGGITIGGATGCRYQSSGSNNSSLSSSGHYMIASRTSAAGKYYYVFTTTVDVVFVAPGSGGTPAGQSSTTPAPAKYSGPEFSGLSSMGVMTGSSPKLEGKRLNEISSIEIGGKAATFTSTETELKLDVPKDLAPGLYDLVINSSAGKLTHRSAIRVLGPLKSFSATTRSEGKISIFHYLEHSLIASRQAPQLNKARCVVNASSKEAATQMAESLCARVRAANPNIETVVVEARSTVKNNSVFARVIYGWN